MSYVTDDLAKLFAFILPREVMVYTLFWKKQVSEIQVMSGKNFQLERKLFMFTNPFKINILNTSFNDLKIVGYKI